MQLKCCHVPSWVPLTSMLCSYQAISRAQIANGWFGSHKGATLKSGRLQCRPLCGRPLAPESSWPVIKFSNALVAKQVADSPCQQLWTRFTTMGIVCNAVFSVPQPVLHSDYIWRAAEVSQGFPLIAYIFLKACVPTHLSAFLWPLHKRARQSYRPKEKRAVASVPGCV